MNIYMVSYDLFVPGQKYAGLMNRLEEMCALKIMYSQWVLRTNATACQVRDDLRRFVDKGDRLLVTGLTGEAAWPTWSSRTTRSETKSSDSVVPPGIASGLSG